MISLTQNRFVALSHFPEEVAVPTRRIMLALPLVVSVLAVILLDERMVLYGLVGAVAAATLGWFLYLFADRSVTKALFIVLLATIALQQNYMGLPLDSTRISRFLLFLCVVKSLLGGELTWEKTALNGALLVLLVTLFSSILVADEIDASLISLKRYLYLVILCLVVAHTLRDRRFAIRAFKTYAGLACLSALCGIWQFSGFFGQAASNVISEATFGLPRAGGLYRDPNWFGAYLASAFPLSIGFFLGGRGKKEKALWLLAGIVILGGLLFTVSRSALLGFGSTIAVLCIYSRTLRRGYLRAAAQSLYVIIPLGIVFAKEVYLFYVGMKNLVLETMTVYTHLSTELHLSLYKTALRIFTHNPILGVGVGNFHNHIREYMDPNPLVNRFYWGSTSNNMRITVHSSWLDILSDAGLIGLIAYLAVLLVVFRYFHSANREFLNRDPQLFYLSTALMGGMISLCFSGLFYSYLIVAMHWFFVGTSYVMFHLAGKDREVRNGQTALAVNRNC